MRHWFFSAAAGLLLLGMPAFFSGCTVSRNSAAATAVPAAPVKPQPASSDRKAAGDVSLLQTRRHPVKVMLDPGHGGGDLGAHRGRVVEKELNLKLALALGRELTRRGYAVSYTRKTDQFVTLPGRPQMANMAGADLFLSIHHNANASAEPSGCECFALTPAGCLSSDGTLIPGVFAGNRNDAANLLLAAFCQQRLRRAAAWQDRGVKFARFRVLRDVTCPAVLVEAGFVSNPAEARRISRSDHRRKVSTALADAVDDFCRHQWTTAPLIGNGSAKR